MVPTPRHQQAEPTVKQEQSSAVSGAVPLIAFPSLMLSLPWVTTRQRQATDPPTCKQRQPRASRRTSKSEQKPSSVVGGARLCPSRRRVSTLGYR